MPTPIPMLGDLGGIEEFAGRTLEDIIRRINLAARLQRNPSLICYPKARRIEICGEELRLTSALYGIFHLLAKARAERWAVAPGAEEKRELLGWISNQTIATGRTPDGRLVRDFYLELLEEIAEQEIGLPAEDERDSARQRLSTLQRWREIARTAKAGATNEALRDAVANALGPPRTRLKDAITAQFGTTVLKVLGPDSDGTFFGLVITPEAIAFAE